MLDTFVIFTAFFNALQHMLGGRVNIAIDFIGQEDIAVMVIGATLGELIFR